jgi:DNA-binding NtrC family response regulator
MEKQPKNILIVDDDKYILHIFSRILQKQGYNVETADIKLPDTNGTDLLAKIHKTMPNIIKIAITGFPSLEDATKVMDQGATAYLVKPVKSNELVKIIAEKLNTQEDVGSS